MQKKNEYMTETIVHIELNNWDEYEDKGSQKLLSLVENHESSQGFIGFNYSCACYDKAVYYLITVPKEWLKEFGMESVLEHSCADTKFHLFSLDMYPKYSKRDNSIVEFYYGNHPGIKYMDRDEWDKTKDEATRRINAKA